MCTITILSTCNNIQAYVCSMRHQLSSATFNSWGVLSVNMMRFDQNTAHSYFTFAVHSTMLVGSTLCSVIISSYRLLKAGAVLYVMTENFLRMYFGTTSLEKTWNSPTGTNNHAAHYNFMHRIITRYSFMDIENIDY